MKKFLLMITCAVTIFSYAQNSTGGPTGGSTGTGTTTNPPPKKSDIQLANLDGDPVLTGGPGTKKKDELHRPASAGRWQICTHACWLFGHIVAAAYSWYQPSDVPCGRVAWPDEPVYFCEGYMEHGHVVIADSGWTNGDGMEC